MDSRKVTLLDLPGLRRRRARLVVIEAHMRKKGRVETMEGRIVSARKETSRRHVPHTGRYATRSFQLRSMCGAWPIMENFSSLPSPTLLESFLKPS